MDDVFLHGSCLVCQTKVADDDAKQKHVLETTHQNRVAVYSFMKNDIAQMTKSFDGASALYSHSVQRGVSALGLECIYELRFPWNASAPLWICTMCFAAGDSPRDFDAHVDSHAHKETYLNDYGEDGGLAMPELYTGDADKEVVYERLKLDSGENGTSDEGASAQEQESTVEEPAAEFLDLHRIDSPSPDLPTAIIASQFSFQKCGNSDYVNRSVKHRYNFERVLLDTVACGSPEAAAPKRRAEGKESVEAKKPRKEEELDVFAVFNEDDILVIDVSSDSDEPKQEEKSKKEPERKPQGNGKQSSNSKPVQYPHLASRTCINSTRQAANVLVLTPHNVNPLDNFKNRPNDVQGPKKQRVTAPKEQKAIAGPSGVAAKPKDKPSSSSSGKPSSSSSSVKDQHSSQKSSSKPPEAKRRSHSPGYIRPALPYMTDSHKPPTPPIFKRLTRSRSPISARDPIRLHNISREVPPRHYEAPPEPKRHYQVAPELPRYLESSREASRYQEAPRDMSRYQEPPRESSRYHEPPRELSRYPEAPRHRESPREPSRHRDPPREREPSRHREPPREVSPRHSDPQGPPVDEKRMKELKARMYHYGRDIVRLESRRDLVEYLWKQGVEPIRPDDSKAIFFNSAVSKIPDIVGVTNLYPVECFDRPGFETLYCGMCAYWTTSSVMLDKHLVSYIHRMNYLSRNYATFYKIVKDEHDKAMKEKLLTQYVKQIWRNEGSGMMTHKLKCVLSASALSRLWPDYRKFHSDSWKKGVKVEIIHQAAQQEAYERTTAELAVIKEKERHREGDRERERRRSRSREPSHRHSSDRKDRVRDYYDRERGRDHDRHREKRSSRRSPSPHSRPKWSPPGYDEHRSRDSRGHGRYSPPPGGLSEEDQQLRMICSQLGIPDSDLPMARNIIREYSQNLRSNAPPPEPYRSSSPTSARLSSLRNILHQALAMETQQALPPQQFQVPPPTHQFVDSSPLQQIPPIQHQSTQDLWPHGSSIQPSWGVPPPNMNVPPPQPASATFPGFSQTLPDTYSYPPPSGHY